jgi:EAL domain-containing protein (putative c-di-GMP-specific phosphodiesterase class I)
VLLRWNHPQLGFVSPLRFIPVAEDTGLIVPIGAWVLRTAAAQLLAWQLQFPQLRLSINVSAREFRDLNLASRIRVAIKGLLPNSLEIEITESLMIENLALAQQLLDKVRSQGLSVAIDDFGTGLSSLAYLKDLPLDVIKIDKSFIDGVGRDRQSHAIVKTIVDLANNLQLSTVAEGVETAEQADILRAMGVKEFQGYYFARPMPAEAFEAFLNNQPKSAVQADFFSAQKT